MRLSPNFMTEVKNTLSMLGVGMSIFVGYSIYIGNEKFYYKVLMPTVHLVLSAENSHRLAIFMGRYNLFPKFSNKSFSDLNIQVLGLNFLHPVGIAAGFDKHGESVLGLLNAGFSFVEVGSVTPKPQPGNTPPRVFRLPKDEAVINRYGFNSDGHLAVYERLCNIQWKDKGIVGVNLGVNKNSENFTQDYVDGIKRFGEICDYLVINISSPNTENLRKLHKYESLKGLVIEVMKTRDGLPKRTPLFLKISPDESDKDIQDIVKVVLEYNVDGIVVSNSTLSRNNLLSNPSVTQEIGGLSGKPLADRSNEVIARISSMTNRKVLIIGVGGIDSGYEAWKKIMAGATLVQLYTSMTYYGTPIIKKVVNELHNELLNSNCATYQELIIKQQNRQWCSATV